MEFFEQAFLSINLPYTFLMMLVALYWLATFIGVLDLSSLDIDVDTDTEVSTDASGGGVGGLFHFFHIGEMPIMIIISFLALFLWIGSVLANYYLDNTSWGVAAILFVPLLIGSLLLTKVFSIPFVMVFRKVNQPDDVTVEGKVCTLRSTADEENMGLAEVKLDGIAQTIYVIPQNGLTLHKGEQALVLMKDEEKNCYLVEPFHGSEK